MQTASIRLLASRQEAAEALNVSIRTVDVLADKGELRPVRIGARKLFPWSEVRRLAGDSTDRGAAPTGPDESHREQCKALAV